MRLSTITGLVAWAFAHTATAATDPSVLLPTQDSWYTPPSNVNSYTPGQVIKSRDVSNHINGYYGSFPSVTVSNSTQFMYRTTDSLGNAVAAVMTLLVPSKADPTKLWAHQTAYDSVNLNCVPSYSLRSGANETAQTDIIYIAAALNNGYYVMTPDFYGLSGEFSVGLNAGHSVLDAVRAALVGGLKYGLRKNPSVGLWGYSGGAFGTEWAIELQPTYAPELKFVGAAIGGLSPNFQDVLLTLNKGISAGLCFSGFQGVANAYPSFKNLLNQRLIPWMRDEFFSLGSGCLNGVSNGAFKDVFSYFINGQNFLYESVTQATLKAAGLAGQYGTPTMPLFVIQAVGDEIAPIADVDALIKLLCNKGAIIEYHRDHYGEHISEALTEGPEAFQWLSDRLAGKALQQSVCITKETFVNTFNPSQYPALGNLYLSYLETTYFGGNLGLGISG